MGSKYEPLELYLAAFPKEALQVTLSFEDTEAILNSKLQDKSPKEKASSFEKTGLLIVQDVAEIIRTEGWGRPAIDAREEELLDWVKSEWD